MAELREVREDIATRQVHVTTYVVWDLLANILDKKVNEVGLNCLEALVDYFCTWLYTTYNTMYELKMRMREYGLDIAHPERVSIHRLRNNTPLYDFSDTQEARVRHAQMFDHQAQQNDAGGIDQIVIRANGAACRVLFFEHPDTVANFEENTRRMVVTRNAQTGLFKIDEFDTEGGHHAWTVNPQITVEIPPVAQPGRPAANPEAVHIASPANPATEALAAQQDESAFGAALNRLGYAPQNRRKIGMWNGVHLFATINLATKCIELSATGRLTLYDKYVRNAEHGDFILPQTSPWGRSFAVIEEAEHYSFLVRHFGQTRQDFALTHVTNEHEKTGFVGRRTYSYYVAAPVRA